MTTNINRSTAVSSIDPEEQRRTFATDAAAVVASCAIATAFVSIFSSTATFAGVVYMAVVCGAFWSWLLSSVGLYRRTYARHPHDEYYYVATAFGLGAIPFLLISAVTRSAFLLEATAASWLLATVVVGVRRSRRITQVETPSLEDLAPLRPPHPSVSVMKRFVDVVVATVAIVLTSPIMVVAALLIYFDSGEPILFKQYRVGRDGVPFEMLKFRTMRPNTSNEWAKPGDNRITRVGAFLRRASIDELPQFFNVLLGEMSVVGPRPETQEFADYFNEKDPRYAYRHFVAPGITGWAQLYMPRNLTPDDMPEVLRHDLFYVKNASAFLDLVIIMKTAAEFLSHHAV